MNQQNEISDYISELISIGYSSLNRDNGLKSLEAFKTIYRGLKYLENDVSVFSEDISKCVTMLRLLVELREKVIRSKDVLDSQIPNIYKSVDLLNKLFTKSANNIINEEDPKSITNQCEWFLKSADQIRNDKNLKGLGILDGNLKNAIGRLRKKATIESVFMDEHLKNYNLITSEAGEILIDGDLQSIGMKLLDLKKKFEKLENNHPHRTRLLGFIGRYEKSFIKKIKSQMNKLDNKSKKASLYDIQEIMNMISAMEDLIEYHKNKGLNISIRRLKKSIQEKQFFPRQENLSKAKEFVLNASQKPFWQDYETLYLKKYQENEIFSDSFYEYTLKGLAPEDISSLLLKKIEKLKKLDLSELKYVPFEQRFEKELGSLVRTFGFQG